MRRLFAWAPAWMWLFWLSSAVLIAGGFWRGGEPQPRFLVATGTALEIWHGAERESTLFKFDDGSSIMDAALSPDGTRIAFTRFVVGATQAVNALSIELYVMSRDGSGARPILQLPDASGFIETPLWLSNDELAYAIFSPTADGGTDRRIESVNLPSGTRRRLVADADQPGLMANGRLIVRLADSRPGRSDETPVTVDIASGRVEDLPGYKMLLLFIGAFVQSPDGTQIAFSAADPSVRAPVPTAQRGTSAPRITHPILQDIWLMDLDGGNLRRIADLAVGNPSLAWSQDGVFVYAMSSIGFWRINAKTGAHQKIGPGLQNGRISLLPSC